MSRFVRKIRKWTVDALDLPSDLVFDLPRLTLIGGQQLYIENHRGVIHFSPEALHLALSQGTLEVEGANWSLKPSCRKRSLWKAGFLASNIVERRNES